MSQHTRNRQDAEPIGPILSRFLTSSGLNQFLAHQKLRDGWREAVGPELLRHTRIISLRGHVLRVQVDSAAHCQELAAFHKGSILQRLRTGDTPFLIQDIEFRIGSF